MVVVIWLHCLLECMAMTIFNYAFVDAMDSGNDLVVGQLPDGTPIIYNGGADELAASYWRSGVAAASNGWNCSRAITLWC